MNALQRRARRRSTRRLGFTLVEMMVAMLAGSFAIAGVYYLGGMSSRVFNEQMRVSETQMSLRSAMDQLRRDLGRAGYLATRDALRELAPSYASGTVSTVPIQAVSITSNGSLDSNTQSILDPSFNLTRIDRLELVGNYTTSDAYLLNNGITDPQTLQLDATTEAFGRSFVDPACGGGASVYSKDRFEEVFKQGRWVSIETKTTKFFRQIDAPDGNNFTIRLTSALDGDGAVGWGIVAPIDRIAYTVQPVTNNQIARLLAGSNDTNIGAQRTVLVREALKISDGSPSDDNTMRPVLDYAVEFAVNALVDISGGGGAPPLFDFASPGGGSDVDIVSTNSPNQFRAAVVTLSARTPEADPRIARVPRPSLNAPFLAFRVAGTGGTSQLWARVRTLRSEIFMPNMLSAR